LSGNGLDWLCRLAGNSQRAPTIFFKFSGYFFNYFIKNPQTTIALTFLTHIISAIDGVPHHVKIWSGNPDIFGMRIKNYKIFDIAFAR
jgi:hypothetical protein